MQTALCNCGVFVESCSRDERHLNSGYTASISRCFNSVTGTTYAVKKIPVGFLAEDSQVLTNEVNAQQAAAAHQVPRVVQLFAAFRSATDELCLVLEQVHGWELYHWPHLHKGPLSPAEHEIRVKEVAVQLLETLDELHGCAKYAHLDLSKNNIMIRSDSADKWDQLRLLDFGYSMKCVTDEVPMHRQNVLPQGCTHIYASPQQLRSLQLQIEQDSPCSLSFTAESTPSIHVSQQHQQFPLDPQSLRCRTNATAARHQERRSRRACFPWGQKPEVVEEPVDVSSSAAEEDSMYINGRAADIFAAGVILYELLTGELPFKPVKAVEKPTAPEWILPEDEEQWERCRTILQLQTRYAQEISDHVASSRRAFHFGHPLFDRVRACSSEPDAAAAFFGRLLWPWAETRASAGSMLKSTYMESTLHEMLQDRRHASMQAGKHGELYQTVTTSATSVRDRPIPGHSTQDADLHIQSDVSSLPLKQPETPAGSSADLGPCCPAGADDCPAMHIQFLPDPASILPAAAATTAAAQLPDRRATELWLERQLSSIAASNSIAAEPSPHVALQPSSPQACAAVTPSSEVLNQLSLMHCPQESPAVLRSAMTGLQPIGQPQMSPVIALPSAQVTLQTPLQTLLPQTATSPALSPNLHTHKLTGQPVLGPISIDALAVSGEPAGSTFPPEPNSPHVNEPSGGSGRKKKKKGAGKLLDKMACKVKAAVKSGSKKMKDLLNPSCCRIAAIQD